MKLLLKVIPAYLFFSLSMNCYAEPKVTQAAFVDLKTNGVIALSVEEFDKHPSLLLFKENKQLLFSTQFSEEVDSLPEYEFVNPFIRFKSFHIEGLPAPLLIALCVEPGGSDESCEVKLIAEKRDKKIALINPGEIQISIQDGFYLGYINKEYGDGMILWQFQWDAAHYAPHRYKIKIYSWNNEQEQFILRKEFITKEKFKCKT